MVLSLQKRLAKVLLSYLRLVSCCTRFADYLQGGAGAWLAGGAAETGWLQLILQHC
jgi:hypothetical protein